MALWRVRSWEEVEKLASITGSCIAPGKNNYERAKEDFSDPDVIYYGFTASVSMDERRITKGYLRVVVLGERAFLDFMAPNEHEYERNVRVYRRMETAAKLLKKDEKLRRFYVGATGGRTKFFKRGAVPQHEWLGGTELPSFTNWIRSGYSGFWIDIL